MFYYIRMKKWLVGVDEAGRGPLAGPLAVCALWANPDILELYRGVGDSKQLTPKAREKAFAEIFNFKKEGRVNYGLILVAPQRIDAYGMSASLRFGVERALSKLELIPSEAEVLLDGSLKAPEVYTTQTTIIKGDEKEPVIGMASIVAKVLRDRRMLQIAKEYPQYAFEKHKGYGTAAHYAALKVHGPSLIHRKSFL